jgi:hypothetical protein
MRHRSKDASYIRFGCCNHFTSLRINFPDRRSGTLGPEELFTGTLEGGRCFLPISMRVRFFAKRRVGRIAVLEEVAPGNI